MKKQNTWLTIALGGLVTVTVAAVAIVWSGTRTKENPDIVLESDNSPNAGMDYTEEVLSGDRENVGTPGKQEDDEKVVYGTWGVNEEIISSYIDHQIAQEKPSQTTVVKQDTEEPLPENSGDEAVEAAGNQVLTLNFAPEDRVSWPVQGNVIQYYSMDTTVYFPTLEQYKCSPAIEIQSEAGTAVNAPANAKVVQIGEDAKIGRYLRLELGNEYEIILGQLADVCVTEGDYIARGTQIGTVASPTRYFVVEGDNVYFQMLHGEETVDPLDYLE